VDDLTQLVLQKFLPWQRVLQQVTRSLFLKGTSHDSEIDLEYNCITITEQGKAIFVKTVICTHLTF
jgi:hypothetical protein